MSKKMEEVKEANVRVVSEDFLQDVSASTKSLQELLCTHILSPWGAEMKAEVKAEPVEAVAPRGKSGGALPKKSKGPIREEGEAPAAPSRQPRPSTASPSAPRGLSSVTHTNFPSLSLWGWWEVVRGCCALLGGFLCFVLFVLVTLAACQSSGARDGTWHSSDDASSLTC